MIEFTAEARVRFDEYVSAVRQSAAGSKDVEEDIRDHVDAALASLPAPVRLEDLERVLSRLGSPASWVREEELPWWRRLAYRITHGPEDWRLAYLAFGLTPVWFCFPLADFFCCSRHSWSAAPMWSWLDRARHVSTPAGGWSIRLS